tara:strand:- start:448 stop:1209 length:762 start_codon:yes stop_codon:yes gene_type:complete
MAYVMRDDVRLYYEDHGSGPAVLLTHGYGATSQMWQDQVAEFKDRYRIIVWDLRGHGESDYPDDPDLYSKQHTVADIGALLDACSLERAVIGGHSLGGYSTLAFHRVHPERCDALMLFNCGPGFKKNEARLKWNETAERRAKRFEDEGLTLMGDRAEFLRAEHRNANGLAHAARGMLAHDNSEVIFSLPEIQKPTLVLVGVDDTPFIAAADYMAAKIAGAEKAVIENANHAANLDNPDDFNAAMGEFLAGLNI